MNTIDEDGTALINVDDKFNKSVISYIDTALINTVDDNSSSYTCFYYLKVQLLSNIQRIIRRTSTKYYKRYVSNNYIVN